MEQFPIMMSYIQWFCKTKLVREKNAVRSNDFSPICRAELKNLMRSCLSSFLLKPCDWGHWWRVGAFFRQFNLQRNLCSQLAHTQLWEALHMSSTIKIILVFFWLVGREGGLTKNSQFCQTCSESSKIYQALFAQKSVYSQGQPLL